MPTIDHTARSGIYQIRNLKNGKVYIGSAVNIKKRWAHHRRELRNGTHKNDRLQNSWNKHGEDSFVFEVLEFVAIAEDLIRVEQDHIDRTRSFDDTIGYNISATAGSPLGVRRTPEERAKISEAAKRQMADPEMRALLSSLKKGIPLSEEHKAKLSEVRTGRKLSESHRKAVAAANRQKAEDPEIKAKISAFHLGRKRGPMPPEEKARRSLALKGRVFSEEHRAKLSDAGKSRKPPSEETRRKMSESAKRRKSREKADRERIAWQSGLFAEAEGLPTFLDGVREAGAQGDDH